MNNLSIIIRYAGERTLPLCKNIIQHQYNEPIHVIENGPFYKTLKNSYKLALELNKKYTLFIDADVIPNNNWPNIIKPYIQNDIFDVFNFCCKDKLFLRDRQVGVRLYKTKTIEKLIECIDSKKIRPEQSAIDLSKLRQKNNIKAFGKHDYEQYFKDIFRKSIFHLHKHKQRFRNNKNIINQWKKLSKNDLDFKVCILGYEHFKSNKDKYKHILCDKSCEIYMCDKIFKENGIIEKEPYILNEN